MTFAAEVLEGLTVVDADSHFTDVQDLWTKRAPAAFKDQILHVEDVDGERQWVIEGTAVGKAGGGSTIDREGVKHPFLESMIEWDFDAPMSPPGTSTPDSRCWTRWVSSTRSSTQTRWVLVGRPWAR